MQIIKVFKVIIINNGVPLQHYLKCTEYDSAFRNFLTIKKNILGTFLTPLQENVIQTSSQLYRVCQPRKCPLVCMWYKLFNGDRAGTNTGKL